jgi:hypothetical protein
VLYVKAAPHAAAAVCACVCVIFNSLNIGVVWINLIFIETGLFIKNVWRPLYKN